MTLWVIPWPYDYHEMGAVVVMAPDKETALSLGQEWYAKAGSSSYRGAPEWDKIAENEDGAVYENQGCDC